PDNPGGTRRSNHAPRGPSHHLRPIDPGPHATRPAPRRTIGSSLTPQTHIGRPDAVDDSLHLVTADIQGSGQVGYIQDDRAPADDALEVGGVGRRVAGHREMARRLGAALLEIHEDIARTHRRIPKPPSPDPLSADIDTRRSRAPPGRGAPSQHQHKCSDEEPLSPSHMLSLLKTSPCPFSALELTHRPLGLLVWFLVAPSSQN